MKILIFTEGTITMHNGPKNRSRKTTIYQVENKFPAVHDYASYIPIKNAVKKIATWKKQGATIYYLTSRRTKSEIQDVRAVLKRYNFPKGILLFRKKGEEYKDVAERFIPDILIEDDCESIGGIKEMTITHISQKIKKLIKSIPIREFTGIDHLPEDNGDLLNYGNNDLSKNPKPIVSMISRAIILKDDKILLIHRFKKQKSITEEYFTLPGGHVEPGETVEDTLLREIKEETNLTAKINKKLWVLTRPKKKSKHHFFLVTEFKGRLKLGGPELKRNCKTNRYILEWHNIKEISSLNLHPNQLKSRLIRFINQKV